MSYAWIERLCFENQAVEQKHRKQIFCYGWLKAQQINWINVEKHMFNSEPSPKLSTGWLGIVNVDLKCWLFQSEWAWSVYLMGVQTKTTPWRRDSWDHDELLEHTKVMTTMAVSNLYKRIRPFPETLFSFNLAHHKRQQFPCLLQSWDKDDKKCYIADKRQWKYAR